MIYCVYNFLLCWYIWCVYFMYITYMILWMVCVYGSFGKVYRLLLFMSYVFKQLMFLRVYFFFVSISSMSIVFMRLSSGYSQKKTIDTHRSHNHGIHTIVRVLIICVCVCVYMHLSYICGYRVSWSFSRILCLCMYRMCVSKHLIIETRTEVLTI